MERGENRGGDTWQRNTGLLNTVGDRDHLGFKQVTSLCPQPDACWT